MKNFFFSTLIALFLLGPLATVAANALEAPLPPFLSNEDAQYLSGSAAKSDILSSLDLEGFQTGELQKNLEDELGANIPAKGTVLLLNAALDRQAIKMSNLLFDWQYIPSFYGSNLLLDVRNNRLVENPSSMYPGKTEHDNSITSLYIQAAKQYPHTRMFVYCAPTSKLFVADYAPELRTNPITYAYYQKCFKTAIENSGATNLEWIDGNASMEEFLGEWYRTDHHWNIEGAYKGYCEIAEAMGNTPVKPKGDEKLEYSSPIFYGSLVRRALDLDYHDYLLDLPFDLPEYNVKVNGEKEDMESLVHSNLYAEENWSKNKFQARYGEYFHWDLGLIEIENPNQSNGKELLIVGDSFTNSIERLFAFNYQKTYVIDPRHYNQTFEEFMQGTDERVTDVLFLFSDTYIFDEDIERFLTN